MMTFDKFVTFGNLYYKINERLHRLTVTEP
jgi:hypothetical protein